MTNTKLAYGVAYSSSTKGYMGAVLITDEKGFPLEFKYSDPIIPTKIQQVLYGQGLEKYIKMDVITDSLLKSLSSRIDYLFVQDEDLLGFKSDSPLIVRISETKTSPLSYEGEISKVKNNEYLVQTSKASSPIRLKLKEDFNEDDLRFNTLVNNIVEVGKFIDVTEPLDRVHKTIELICNQEI